MKQVSRSFAAGAIALVFAVLGYQTALLVHYSAVAKIIANRDEPDTVYVYTQTDSSPHAAQQSYATDSPHAAVRRTERRNAAHSEQASKLRSFSAPAVETFRFNPNTVSVDDLMRLGFSAKQAQSIDNYRNKGGVFHRKEDFAESYVVADSVYARLEDYIDIPRICLNTADSASFDSLPGIGGYFASKMVEYRTKLGGYSCKEQLMDIYNFNQERFDAIKDLVDLGPLHPYPLWTLPADSLRLHPYIRNASAARSIVLFRTHTPKDQLSVEALCDAGILPGEDAERLLKCVIAEP